MASFNKKFQVPGTGADVIYNAVSSGIDKFLSKTPLANCEVSRDEKAKKVSFKHSMASGSILAKDSEIEVDVKLSLFATPFKGKVEEGITHWLNKTFGA